MLKNFVVPHKVSYDSFFLGKIKKLAKIQTLQFPIIFDIEYEKIRSDSILNAYPNSFFNISFYASNIIERKFSEDKEVSSRIIGLTYSDNHNNSKVGNFLEV